MKKSIDDNSTDRATLEKWAQSFDAAAHKQLSTLAHGLSPISLGLAYADWLAHLSASPGSQSLRMIDAWQSYLRAMEKNVQLKCFDRNKRQVQCLVQKQIGYMDALKY